MMDRQNEESWLDEAILRAVGSGRIRFDSEKWLREHPKEVQVLKSLAGRGSSAVYVDPGGTWRIILTSRITKLAAAAAVIVVAFLGLALFTNTPDGAGRAWAIEQTIEALEDVRTCTASGTAGGTIPFKCWAKRDDKRESQFKMRYESKQEVVVVNGDVCHAYAIASNKVYILDGPSHQKLRFWWKAMELKLWLARAMLQRLKENADDWEETYGQDKQTGRECVFVTCSYKALQSSFWFQFDLETNLAVRYKQWFNVDRKGPPTFDADQIVYNEEVPDALFDFQIPEGAKVVVVSHKEMKELGALEDKAWKPFKNKQYKEAIKAYQRIYDEYPDHGSAVNALMMVGICHDWLGQYDEAIESYEKAVREYPDERYRLASTYWYLGNAYLETGQRDKALQAYKNCLQVGQGVRDPDGFPMKDAKKAIEKIESGEIGRK
jgi:outer membrane lipoprotein-sorting protein